MKLMVLMVRLHQSSANVNATASQRAGDVYDCLTPNRYHEQRLTPLRYAASGRSGASRCYGHASAAQAETPALGKNAKSVRQLPSDGYQDRRAAKFKHQRAAAKLLPSERVSNCLWAVTDRFYGVDVVHNCIEQRARPEPPQHRQPAKCRQPIPKRRIGHAVFLELLVMLMGVAASAITIVQAVGRLVRRSR